MTPDDFQHFHAAHATQVLRAAWAYCGDREVAEDAVQDAFVRAARDWRKVSRMASPGGWLHRVAINRVHDTYRRRGAAERARRKRGAPPTSSPPVDVATITSVRDAVATLPDAQRLAVALHHLADLSVVDTAAVMRMPEGTVKSHLHRGRAALRDLLATTEESSDVR